MISNSCRNPFAVAAPAKPVRFQATIRKIWMLRHVDVPEEIGRTLEKESGTKKHIPVIASVNGCSVRTTLFPAGAGRYRLQIKTELRKAAGADTGDLIGVEIRYDRESREIEVPSELKAILKDHPKARRAFDDMPPGHKRQLLLFYLRAKSPRARENAASKVVDHLLERALLGPKKKKAAKPESSPCADK
jgi:hypothetical protein